MHFLASIIKVKKLLSNKIIDIVAHILNQLVIIGIYCIINSSFCVVLIASKKLDKFLLFL